MQGLIEALDALMRGGTEPPTASLKFKVQSSRFKARRIGPRTARRIGWPHYAGL